VPDWDTLKPWAEQNGFKATTFEEVCNNPKAKAAVLKTLAEHCKKNELKGFEIVRNIHLTSEQFTPENGILSPTFKLKRHEAKNKYIKIIERLYAEMAN
jgi:long-chain acyl-CoA synthetase